MSQLKARALAKGLATFVPGLGRLACRQSGGTVSARYCYSVWLRHLVKAADAGLPTSLASVAELGPGDSFGIGLAAMLSGVDAYYALDARAHADRGRNLAVLGALHQLFLHRAPIPDDAEFPFVRPRLADYSFPSRLLTEARLARALATDRVAAIADALRGGPSGSVSITYAAPWNGASAMRPGGVDLIYSQAVLEHVDDVGGTYRALRRWLRPTGFMSHAIDFKSHGVTRDWNGHWTVAAATWKLVRGRRPYFINRLPHSAHLETLRQAGFRIVLDVVTEAPALARATLAPEFAGLPEEDLRIDGAFVIAAP